MTIETRKKNGVLQVRMWAGPGSTDPEIGWHTEAEIESILTKDLTPKPMTTDEAWARFNRKPIPEANLTPTPMTAVETWARWNRTGKFARPVAGAVASDD